MINPEPAVFALLTKDKWVVNNLFYRCRGDGFRSPLSIMNGVPNSPAFRYVPVTDAVVAGNSFFQCAPISLCEGSDTERSVVPNNVLFANNIFYNTKDSTIYNTYDDISGLSFSGNLVTKTLAKTLSVGFEKTNLSSLKTGSVALPAAFNNLTCSFSDSVQKVSQERLGTRLSETPGFANGERFLKIEANANSNCGAKWFTKKRFPGTKKTITAECKNGEELARILSTNAKGNLIVNLTGPEYNVSGALNIKCNVQISSNQKKPIHFTNDNDEFCFQLIAGNSLIFDNLSLELSKLNSKTFITTDTSGSSNHSSIVMISCNILNSTGIFFNAAKSSIADSIVIRKCTFSKGQRSLFKLNAETDKKGYYNVEHFLMISNSVKNYNGQVLTLLRSGKDESTMGPIVLLNNNRFINSNSGKNASPIIALDGVQRSFIENNHFTNCSEGGILVNYKDEVRADHFFKKNTLIKSGEIITDKYVTISY